MAVSAAVNDLYEVRLVGQIEGQETNNVMHFQCVGADADVETHLIIAMITCFTTNLLPVLTSAWEFKRVVWKKVSPDLGLEYISLPTGTTTGGGSAAALPSYCSAVISKRTNTGGRTHRGRMYIAGIPEDQTTGSHLNAEGPLWAGLIAFALCMLEEFVHIDPIGSNLWDLIVYSRKLGGSIYPLGLSGSTAVRELIPASELGTTRSRKVGRGS